MLQCFHKRTRTHTHLNDHFTHNQILNTCVWACAERVFIITFCDGHTWPKLKPNPPRKWEETSDRHGYQGDSNFLSAGGAPHFRKRLNWSGRVSTHTHTHTHTHTAPAWSSGSALDHRSLAPVFESRRGHIWRVFHLRLLFITFGGRSAHLAYHAHKSLWFRLVNKHLHQPRYRPLHSGTNLDYRWRISCFIISHICSQPSQLASLSIHVVLATNTYTS